MYRGISVQRIVQAINASDTSAKGPALKQVPLGDRVRVTVQIVTPDALTQPVLVRIPLPGGLEPLDPAVVSTSAQSMGASDVRGPLIDPACPVQAFRSPTWSCPRTYVMPQVVELRYVSMPSGVSEASFLAIAASRGTWALPPATATVVGEPEVGGLSSGGGFVVCEGDGCAAAAADDSAQGLQGCANDCSGAGWCDTQRGRCLCNEGFSGDDCSLLQTE